MNGSMLLHRDCRHFAPVDAMKGICHRTKEMVASDDERCRNFERMPKCLCCRNYLPDGEITEIGTCKAAKLQFMAYGDMVSITCESFAESTGQ